MCMCVCVCSMCAYVYVCVCVCVCVHLPLLYVSQVNTKEPGHDINVTDVWELNITGEGVVIAVVDDGE